MNDCTSWDDFGEQGEEVVVLGLIVGDDEGGIGHSMRDGDAGIGENLGVAVECVFGDVVYVVLGVLCCGDW